MARRRGQATVAVHGGREGNRTEPVVTPIVQSSTFAAADTRTLEDVYEGRAPGHIYTRYANPTTEAAAEKVALLEGGERCVLTASGMSAIALCVLATVPPGGRVVSSDDVYGGTDRLFEEVLPALGITVDRFPAPDPDALRAALERAPAHLLYVETPTNPTTRLVDLGAAAEAARAAGCPLAVDSTLATPVNSRPLELGAQVVVHSATKYLGGHSDLVAGAVVASGELCGRVDRLARTLGPTLDPFAAFLLARGLATLPLRVRQANANAQAVAELLEGWGPPVARVHYPGLPSHPQHELARRQMPGGFGGLLAFDLEGGLEQAAGFVDALRLVRNAASLGGVESLASIPVVQSHRGLSPETLRRRGITPGTVRLALGVEDAEDLLEDVAQALRSL